MLVAQSCLTLCDPMDCSLPGFSVHGILQARKLEWVAIPFSRGSSWHMDWTQVSHMAGRFFTVWPPYEEIHDFSSVQFSCSVVSYSLWPRGLHHARLPCPSPTPRVYSNPYPLSHHHTGDAIQLPHPLSSPSPLAFSLSQHQGLFHWVSSSY